jgi:dTDP-4-dehydrorhamnose 3,5-epimerase-like enzyme
LLFIQDWIDAQTDFTETVSGDVKVCLDDFRKASFFRGKWVPEAIFQYLNSRFFDSLASSSSFS